jgi:hypothetical protein
MAQRRLPYGALAWRGDASRPIVPRTDIGSRSPVRPSSAAGLGQPLTPGELEVWRGLSGVWSSAGQEADLAELARQRERAATSAALRRMRQKWDEREIGEDR